MPTIVLQTIIKAPIQGCFDASLNIDLHKASVPKQSNEKAIGGKTNGILGLNETVTWRAKHLGFYFNMTVKITEMNAPFSFTDEQVKGPFKIMKHQHRFIAHENTTEMQDVFYFEAPLGVLGKWAEKIVLKSYMQRLLEARNLFLKAHLEEVLY